MFIIYSPTLKGNPMGPIKSPRSPHAYLESAGAGPVLRRRMHLEVEQTALHPTARHPPFLLPALQTLQDSAHSQDHLGLPVLPSCGAGKLGRVGLAFEVREGPTSQLQDGLEYSRRMIGKERGPVMEEKSRFKFSSREKRAHGRQNTFPVCGP